MRKWAWAGEGKAGPRLWLRQPGGHRGGFNRAHVRSPEAEPGSGLDPLGANTCGLQRKGAVPLSRAVFPEFRGKRAGVVSS